MTQDEVNDLVILSITIKKMMKWIVLNVLFAIPFICEKPLNNNQCHHFTHIEYIIPGPTVACHAGGLMYKGIVWLFE